MRLGDRGFGEAEIGSGGSALLVQSDEQRKRVVCRNILWPPVGRGHGTIEFSVRVGEPARALIVEVRQRALLKHFTGGCVAGQYSHWVDLHDSYEQHVEFKDVNGKRHMVRATSIQMIGDADEMATETYIVAAGRTVIIPTSFDTLRDVLAEENCPPPRR